jgi:tRNA dimethylallyltransferase
LTSEPLIAIAGPTGSGKSRVALKVAAAVGAEIVNYDSVQIYRDFDIGSAKPSPAERATLPHHLFDIVEASEDFDAARYAALARQTFAEITARGSRAIFVGGTGFYLRAVVSGLPEMPGRSTELRARLAPIFATERGRHRLHRLLGRIDPPTAARVSPSDRVRIERALEVYFSSGKPISFWPAPGTSSPPLIPYRIYALQIRREELVRRLEQRVEEMFAAGLLEETSQLLSRYPLSSRPFESIGYREAVRCLRGEISREDAIAETKRRTRAYAKRQMTWLRGEREVHWIDADDSDAAASEILRSMTGRT